MMAVSENDTSDCNSDSSADGTSKERKEKFLTKAIIRRLPPSMTKEIFLDQISPVPDYDYMYFVKADLSLGEYAYSRAYINFKNSPDIFLFKEKFDNYVFLDSKGNEYPAVVEFAPFTRIPKKRNKTRVDPKGGTIESDPLYTDFLESLKTVVAENEEKPEYCFQPVTEEEKQKIINTPLLDFIKQRRIDRQKIREEKREERKRKELERKRFKEEERRRRARTDNPPYRERDTQKPPATSKNIQILNSPKETAQDEKKEDAPVKTVKSKYDKYEDKYDRKPKEDRKYPPYQKTNKDLRKPVDDYKKSPLKNRSRYDKPDIRRKEDVYRRKEDSYRGRRNDYKEVEEERVVEKKVKKYSERREERRNEIKKFETLKEDKRKEAELKEDSKELRDEVNDKSVQKTEPKPEKSESKISEISSEKFEKQKSENKSDDSDDRSSEQNKERDRNDPRTQRRIRNKDRPTMAIYQPGMGFRRKQHETEKKIDKSDNEKPCETKANDTKPITEKQESPDPASGSDVKSNGDKSPSSECKSLAENMSSNETVNPESS